MSEIEKFTEARNEVLMSMDEEKIRAFFKKWNGNDMPKDSETFWCSVHKAITGCTDLPREFRLKSKQWLEGRDYMAFDDGDL